MDVTLGSSRFWCHETPQYTVGVCAELAIVAGYPSTFVWSVPDGALLATWPSRPLTRGVEAIRREGDTVVADHHGWRTRFALADGAVLSEEPSPPGPTLSVELDRQRATLTTPQGGRVTFSVPWNARAMVARDGGRYVLDLPSGPVVYDALTRREVFVAPRAGSGTLSADGKLLVVSLFGPPRTPIYEVDTGRLVTPDDPPTVGEVTFCEGDLVVVDGDSWSLAEGRKVAALEGAWEPLAVVGDALVAPSGRSLGRWSVRTGERSRSVPLEGKVETASVDASGRYVVVTLFLTSGLLYQPLPGVWWVDLEAETVRSLPLDEGHETRGVALSPDGLTLAVLYDDEVRWFDPEGRSLRPATALPGVYAARYSPDGGRLLAWWEGGEPSGRGVSLLEDGVEVARLPLGGCRGWWGNDLLCERQGRFERLDARTGEPLAWWCAEDPYREVWLGDRYVATAPGDGTVRVMDLVWRAP